MYCVWSNRVNFSSLFTPLYSSRYNDVYLSTNSNPFPLPLREWTKQQTKQNTHENGIENAYFIYIIYTHSLILLVLVFCSVYSVQLLWLDLDLDLDWWHIVQYEMIWWPITQLEYEYRKIKRKGHTIIFTIHMWFLFFPVQNTYNSTVVTSDTKPAPFCMNKQEQRQSKTIQRKKCMESEKRYAKFSVLSTQYLFTIENQLHDTDCSYLAFPSLALWTVCMLILSRLVLFRLSTVCILYVQCAAAKL